MLRLWRRQRVEAQVHGRHGPLSGVKRTWLFAPRTSAYDPKRASRIPAVTAGYDFNRGKELPIRERWLKDWERWT